MKQSQVVVPNPGLIDRDATQNMVGRNLHRRFFSFAKTLSPRSLSRNILCVTSCILEYASEDRAIIFRRKREKTKTGQTHGAQTCVRAGTSVCTHRNLQSPVARILSLALEGCRWQTQACLRCRTRNDHVGLGCGCRCGELEATAPGPARSSLDRCKNLVYSTRSSFHTAGYSNQIEHGPCVVKSVDEQAGHDFVLSRVVAGRAAC